MPPSYWAEALSTATLLLNILPTKTLRLSTPHLALYGMPPTYDHLRVFGCKCYPNLSATAPHKLAPRSALCVFLGYSAHHKGYRCLDLSTNRVIISRHVIFDEMAFPFAERNGPSIPADFDFLDATDVVPAPIGPLHKFLSAGTPSSTSNVTSAPAGPSETVPGVPPTPPVAATDPPADTADPPAPALYIPPALRTPGTPPAPRVAQDAPSTTGGAPPRQLYIPPTLCASSQSPALTAGSTAPVSPPQAPRRPPPGFPPLRPDRAFSYHYTRWPRPQPAPIAPVIAAPAAPAPAAPVPPPKGAVAVPPVIN